MKRFDFAMLVVFIMVSSILALVAFSSGGMDFGVYYAAARVARMGGNPYDYQQLAGEIMRSTGTLNNPYYYAPWFTWTMIPLSFFPYATAKLIWAIFNFFLWFLALYNLGRLIDWPSRGWKRWGIYTLITFVFAWSTWGFEQVGILIFFIFTIILITTRDNKWIQSGLWMTFILFKPNVTALTVVALAIWLLIRKKWQPVIVASMGFILMVGLSFIISPNWHLALTEPDKLTGLSHTLNISGGTVALRQNTTLLDWLKAYHISSYAVQWIYISVFILAFIALIAVIFRSTNVVEVTSIAILTGFAITPYALFYDYPSLLITFFYVNAIKLYKPFYVHIRNLLNAFIMLSVFIGNSISFRYWIVIGLATLLVFVFVIQRLESKVAASQLL